MSWAIAQDAAQEYQYGIGNVSLMGFSYPGPGMLGHLVNQAQPKMGQAE